MSLCWSASPSRKKSRSPMPRLQAAMSMTATPTTSRISLLSSVATTCARLLAHLHGPQGGGSGTVSLSLPPGGNRPTSMECDTSLEAATSNLQSVSGTGNGFVHETTIFPHCDLLMGASTSKFGNCIDAEKISVHTTSRWLL